MNSRPSCGRPALRAPISSAELIAAARDRGRIHASSPPERQLHPERRHSPSRHDDHRNTLIAAFRLALFRRLPGAFIFVSGATHRSFSTVYTCMKIPGLVVQRIARVLREFYGALRRRIPGDTPMHAFETRKGQVRFTPTGHLMDDATKRGPT